MKKKDEILVFISLNDFVCSECNTEFGKRAFLSLTREKGALCLSCADLDHLYFLPSGDAALTRRAKKYSKLYAVVLKWSRTRKRYERQGLLVESEALEKAESECLEDAEFRERRRERQAEKRQLLDQQYVKTFAEKIREHYPGCPADREFVIAEHACMKYSGRIGRTADAKSFSDQAIQLAVIAHIRHAETRYDELLLEGIDRSDAKSMVELDVQTVLERWAHD
jgi:hypothetical protein